MNEVNEGMDLLLARYFSGEADANELRELDNWLCESEANQHYFDQLTSLYERTAQAQQPVREPNMQLALDGFMKHIHGNKPSQDHKGKAVGKGGHSVLMRLGSLRKHWPVYAAAASILILLTFSLSQYMKEQGKTRIMSFNGTLEHVLPDGTLVSLSPNSQLEYNKHFGTSDRTLFLKGAALVKVAPANSPMPKFLVKMGETMIEDVGTTFSVSENNADNTISVAVQEGAVLFYTASDTGMRIEGGQSGSYNKTSRKFLAETNNPTPSVHLAFNATPLSEVVEALNKHYNANIKVDKGLEGKTITVEFNQQNLDVVLEIIAQTLYLKITHQGNTIQITE